MQTLISTQRSFFLQNFPWQWFKISEMSAKRYVNFLVLVIYEIIIFDKDDIQRRHWPCDPSPPPDRTCTRTSLTSPSPEQKDRHVWKHRLLSYLLVWAVKLIKYVRCVNIINLALFTKITILRLVWGFSIWIPMHAAAFECLNSLTHVWRLPQSERLQTEASGTKQSSYGMNS